MSWQEQKDIILGFFATGIAGWFLYEMRGLRHSVESLNTKLAEVLTATTYHKERLEKHEHRLLRLEEWKSQ
jgi:hypothetical protein